MSRSWFLLVLGSTGLTLASLAQTTSPPASSSPSSFTGPDTSQEAFVFEAIDNHVRFENDGSGVRDTTARIRIQSQAGIQQFGQLIFGYSSASENLTLNYVRVRKPGGQRVDTAVANAQDFAPDVLKEAPMYSDYRQRHVSVVDLQPGDDLEYSTTTKISALAAGEFWYEHDFPRRTAVQQETLEIDIPRSRAVKLESPDHSYETEDRGERRIYVWTIKDVVPDRTSEGEEDVEDTPDVQISTFADWLAVAHWYARLQGQRVVVDASVRQKAAELTKGATTAGEKARRLYDYVARNTRYVSLSFGIGRFQPHSASEVLANGYGDCKDKHTLLEALLQAEGIRSYPVLINSRRKLDPDMPSPAQFDHVITAVPFGREITWLDTTAEVAPYGMILYQLRNKQALLASDDDMAGLRRTPADSPLKNVVTMTIEGKFTETGAMDTTVDLTAQGDSDWPIREAFRQLPQTEWQRSMQYLSTLWGLTGEVSDVHLSSLEDTSKPFHLSYHFHVDNYFHVPSSGANFHVLPAIEPRPLSPASRKKPLEPIDVGPAEERIYQAHVQFPPNFSIHIPAAVKMTRDYGEYSSSYSLKGNVLDAERRMVLKVNELPASRRSDVESFRNVTSSEVEQGLWCTITPASAAAAAAAAQAGGTPEQMRKAGESALGRKDFTTAVDLLKRAVDQDDKLKDAWDELGQAYAGLKRHDDAIGAFRRQLEVDPYHERANLDLAEELEQKGRLDEAVAAYRKQLEVTPSDRSAHKSLGLLLVQMKRDPEARSELETAVSIPPDDPEAKMALAELYGRRGEKQKADELMKSVIGAAAPGTGTDIYAAALGDDSDPNQVLHDARQTLDNIGDQFDSGEYDRLGSSTFSAMNLVALAWARIGWAKFRQGETLEALQFLNSAWLLSQSGTVGNRLARVFEKEGQRDQARHTFALAMAAGGDDAQKSWAELVKLSADPDSAKKALEQAGPELLEMRTVKLASVAAGTTWADFALVFDSSNKPERAQYLDGDSVLRALGGKLQEQPYPVKFPDVSSVKIVRKARVACENSICSLVLLPLESMTASSTSAP
jgi:tetratricopeptide (TPR) repeat protein/transglutaminase-like putative cysteine protease